MFGATHEFPCYNRVGELVWYRGQFAGEFSVRGQVEVQDGARLGVRLENGNFVWADASQVKLR